MKIYAIIASLLLMVGCVHSSGKSSVVDINGTWKGEMNPGMGPMPGSISGGMPVKPIYSTFNFKKTGDSIKGTVNGNSGQWIPLEDIEIKGKKITFSVTRNIAYMQIKSVYKGKIKGDKIKMSFKTEMPRRSRRWGFSAPDFRMSPGEAGRIGGGMGGFGMGAQTSSNAFTIERVSNETMNPVD